MPWETPTSGLTLTYVLMLTQITTGWYSAHAWEAIRSAISRQFHALLSQLPAAPAAADRARVQWDEPEEASDSGEST